MIHRWLQYADKLRHLGTARALKTIEHAAKIRVQKLIAAPLQPITWQQLNTLGFKQDNSSSLSFLQEIEQIVPDQIIARADRYAQNCFEVLGSGEQCLTTIAWHCDIRLYTADSIADSSFDAHSYYKDILIPINNTNVLIKDIKVPWELARFAYAPILGLAYYHTKNNGYAIAAQNQIQSWLDANQFCYGIHWFNGMEVAIRAVNWIVALQWLHEAWSKDTIFYQRLVCSLYDHMRYLELNWEWYDGRTNNHYLANLVGYAYLCWFFRSLPNMQKKWHWCYAQLLQEFEWQIFDEGTSYEGSTRYHALVTELFMHGFLIAQEMEEVIDEQIRTKLERMILFGEQCKPTADQQSIIIGDDDSGSLLDPLLSIDHFYQHFTLDCDEIKRKSYGTHYYPSFGISLAKESNWHISLRHHAYTNRQPTGHFHQDVGSITIAYKGIPIMVDPGTYVYTASSWWRNYFRSVGVHNTVYGTSQFSYTDLFSLTLERSSHQYLDHCMTAHISLSQGMVQRRVIVEDNYVRIIDQCLFDQPTLLTWNFTFAPSVKVTKQNDHWCIALRSNQQVLFNSPLALYVYDSWVSSHYGVIEKTSAMQASQLVTHEVIEHQVFVSN